MRHLASLTLFSSVFRVAVIGTWKETLSFPVTYKQNSFSPLILKIGGILAPKLITRHLKDTSLSLFASL